MSELLNILQNKHNVKITFTEDDFFNPEFKIKFALDAYPNYAERSMTHIINFFRQAAAIENKFKKDLALFSFNEFKMLFEENNWVSQVTVYNRSTIVRRYMRWYRANRLKKWAEVDINNTINEINIKVLDDSKLSETDWFISLDEIKSEINVLIENLGGEDTHKYEGVIADIYLAWYGVSIEEVVQIKKSDVSITSNIITLPLSNKTIEVDEGVMNHIREYKLSDGYITSRSDREGDVNMSYRESQYLFRSNKNEQLIGSNLRVYLSNFTKYYAEFGGKKNFRHDKIMESGKFLQIVEYEKEYGKLGSGDRDIFEEVFGEVYISDNVYSMNKFYFAFKEYQRFKKYYYENN